jgi:energy-coupling factor transporter transmembrane protein EcfT
MAQIDSQVFDIGYMDRLSRLDTPVHRLDPRAKLLTTLVFVVTVVSFGKYEISALLPFFLYPVVLAAVGEIPLGYLLKKIAVVSPFAIMLGIFNPFFDRGNHHRSRFPGTFRGVDFFLHDPVAFPAHRGRGLDSGGRIRVQRSLPRFRKAGRAPRVRCTADVFVPLPVRTDR